MFQSIFRDKKGNLALLALTLIVAFTYWELQYGEFIYLDTTQYVSLNMRVLSGLSWKNIVWGATTFDVANWHPLTWWSYMLDTTLFQANPRGHFIHNILLHIANTLLLFLLLRRLTDRFWESLLVALLFAVHPLNVENVAWIGQRKSLLATFWGFMAIWTYATYAAQRRWQTYLLSLFCFFLSLLAKPMLVTLPFLFFLLDLWPLNRFPLLLGQWRNFLRQGFRLVPEKIPFLTLAAFDSYMTVRAQGGGGAILSTERLSLFNRLGNVIFSYMRYLKDLFLPGELAVYYPLNYTAHPWPQVIALLIALCAISLVAVLLIKKKPFIFTGWFWYVGTMVPVIGLVQVGGMSHADRYLYFPAIGFFIAVIWSCRELMTRLVLRKVAVALVLILAGFFIFETRALVRIWETSTTLFQHTLRITKGNMIIMNNLGIVYLHQGQLDEAEQVLLNAIKAKDTYKMPFRNLAQVYTRKGEFDKAVFYLKEVLQIEPAFFGAQLDLADNYARMDRKEQAKDALRRAIEIRPGSASTHLWLSNLLGFEETDKAISVLEAAIEKIPDDAELHRALAIFLNEKGERNKAVTSFRRSLALNPTLPDTNYRLGRLFADMNNIFGARKSFEQEIKVNPDFGEPYHTLGMTYIIEGKYREGIGYLIQAVEKDPHLVQSHLELGRFFFSIRDYYRAEKHLEMGLSKDPTHTDCLFLNGITKMQLGYPQEAIRQLKTLLEKDSNSTRAYKELGDAYVMLGKFDEAEQAYQCMLADIPASVPTLVALADLHLNKKAPPDRVKATSLAQQAVAYSANRDASALLILSQAYKSRGQRARALDSAQRALPLARGQLLKTIQALIQTLDPEAK